MKPSAIIHTLTVLVPKKEPVLLVGSPGVGKTSTIEKLAADLGYELIVTHPVVDDPTDYKGMPAVVKVGKDMGAQFLPFGDLWKMITADKPTIVFMDDLGQAPPAVQAAIMQLVLARRINGHDVSPHVVFLAATNRRTDGAAVSGLITPLLDRYTTVLDYEFDLDEWVAWGIANDMPAVLLAFARFKPGLMAEFKPTKDMKKQPTPRSAAAVGRLVNLGLTDLPVLSGAAGEGFATEFVAFYKVWLDLPDRNEIYMNPKKVPVPTDPTVLFALAGSLAHGANTTNWDATLTYLNRMP